MKRDEEELGLQILRALSILRFLGEILEFMVEFLVFFVLGADFILLQQKSRGKRWKSWVLDYGGGRFWWSGGCEMDGSWE
jgi:hypothetical protein